MNFRILKRALGVTSLLALALLARPDLAQAQNSIGVNFAGTPANNLAATDQPGVVAGANFNNVVNSSGTTALNLLDASGAATAASLTVNSGSNYDAFTTPMTSNAATNTMYTGGLFGLGNGASNTEVSITVSSIPYATYDVYVYSSEDTAGSTTPVLSDTIGAQTFYYGSNGTTNSTATSLLLTTSIDPLNPTRGPAQYQHFVGLIGSSFTLTTAGSMSGTISNNVFGLQIVGPTQAVPEPGSVALLVGMATVGITVLRKRRK